MKYQLNKQAMLKLALFAVLAANVSFQPFSPKLSETLLSSEVRTAGNQISGKAAPATPKDAPSKDVSTRTAATKSAAPAGRTVGTHIDTVMCDGKIKHRITFEEVLDEKTKSIRTRATASPRDNSCADCTVKVSIGFPYGEETRARLRSAVELQIIKDNCVDKAQSLAKEVKQETAKAPNATPVEVTVINTPPAAPQATASSATESAENKVDVADLEHRVQICELKKKRIKAAWEYTSLEGNELTRCQLKRLRNLHKELKEELGRRPTKEELADAAREIMTDDMKDEVRELARSKDPEDVREAKEMADELGDALESFRERHGIKDKELRSLERSMKGYEAVADAAIENNEYDSKLDGLRSKMAIEQRAYDRTNNPQYLARLNQLKMQGFNLYNSYQYNMLNNDPFYTIEANQWLSASELNPFRTSFDSVSGEYSSFYNYLMGRGSIDDIFNRTSVVTMPSSIWEERNLNAAGRLNGLSYSSFPATFPDFNRTSQVRTMGLPSANRTGGLRY